MIRERVKPYGSSRLTNVISLLEGYCRHLIKSIYCRYSDGERFSVRCQYQPKKIYANKSRCETVNCLRQAGFTIIELLLVIAIISILGTIAVPSVLTEMPKHHLNGATQKIAGDLMAARMKAIKNNRKVKVFFNSDTQYKICDDADNDGYVDDCEGASQIIDVVNNYRNIIINSNNNPIFHPRGTASNLATISITNSSGTKNIMIAITGRVKIN